MRIPKGKAREDLGPLQRIVSPSRASVFLALAGQVLAFAAMVVLVGAFLTADRRDWPEMLSDWSLWVIPFGLLVVSELLRRATSRRLTVVFEHGVTFAMGRQTRSVRWDAIAKVVAEGGRLALKLRSGEEVALPKPLAGNEAVRAALVAGVKGQGKAAAKG